MYYRDLSDKTLESGNFSMQQQMYPPPQQQQPKLGQSNKWVGCLIAILATIFIIGILPGILVTIGFSSNQAFLGTLLTGGFAIFLWIQQRRKEKQRQRLFLQQQEYARQEQARRESQQRIWQLQQEALQMQQQENARIAREQQERERKERERIAQLHSLGDLLALTAKEFEELTAKILENSGYKNVQVVGGSGDLGVDITAIDTYGNNVVVQCKRYAPGNTIGSPTIQKFIGMMYVHHKVQKGIFVTTTSFSQPAINLAQQHNVLLIDGVRLITLLEAMKRRGQP